MLNKWAVDFHPILFSIERSVSSLLSIGQGPLASTCLNGGKSRSGAYPSCCSSRRRGDQRAPARTSRPIPNNTAAVGSGIDWAVALPTCMFP